MEETCSLEKWLEIADDNAWWAIPDGHRMNLFEEACEEIATLKAKALMLENGLRLCATYAGHHNAKEGCRLVVKNVKDTIAKAKEYTDE